MTQGPSSESATSHNEAGEGNAAGTRGPGLSSRPSYLSPPVM